MVAVPIAVAVSNYLLCFCCGDDFLVSKGEQQTAVVVKQASRLSRRERAFLDFSCSGLLLHSCKQRRLKLRARADRDHIDVGNNPRGSLEELAVAARCNNAAAAAAAIVEQQQQHQQKSRRLQGVVPFTPSSEGGGSRSTCVRGVIEEEPNRSLDNEQRLVVAGPPCPSPAKLLQVAVDVDEVLGSFLSTLNTFIAEEYRLHHELSEYHVYDFMKVLYCMVSSANSRVHAFFESEHFNNGICPIPGAHQTLLQLAAYCNLVVVTSRQHVIRKPTVEWIEQHYAGIFKEVHFGNHFALEGEARPKSEICRSLGVEILIDDNPRYALECAEHGIEVLLFDLHGSYPWSKTAQGPTHPLITRVNDWSEVANYLQGRHYT
ncbi:unnamed protein product [Sphagnum troendelagicum]|uniref:Uncharacterized protein n=1 Tax=Sphagnum troendelagicum TaxID=128251 RepID=A0ABP0TNV7_9BRYO